MMIPKNRDNSGMAPLYIVGPDFVRYGFVGPTLRAEPQRELATIRAAGSSAVLGIAASWQQPDWAALK